MPTELVPLAPHVHYLPGAVNQLVVDDGHGSALIVDSGLDESRAKQLLRSLQAKSLTPTALLTTHSHADHYGGNAFLEARFPDLVVFAPGVEQVMVRHPILEPLYLFGARPPVELQGKFLMARASRARAAPGAGEAQLGSVRVELLDVPGHALMMLAVRVGDVLFASDALFGPDALARHPLTYCVDSAQQKASARKFLTLEGVRVVLPGHGDPTTDLAGLVRVNVGAYERTTQAVRRAAREEGVIDELLARVCDDLGVHMRDPAAVVLNRSVVSAHLVELLERGEVTCRVSANRWLWRTRQGAPTGEASLGDVDEGVLTRET